MMLKTINFRGVDPECIKRGSLCPIKANYHVASIPKAIIIIWQVFWLVPVFEAFPFVGLRTVT